MTKRVYAGSVAIGGGAPVTVQTMTNTKTENLEATLAQIRAMADAGADIVRVSVYNKLCADNVRALCALRGIPHRGRARDSGLPEPTVSRWCTRVVRKPRAAQPAKKALTEDELHLLICSTEEKMLQAAANLDFELAAYLRDKIRALREDSGK